MGVIGSYLHNLAAKIQAYFHMSKGLALFSSIIHKFTSATVSITATQTASLKEESARQILMGRKGILRGVGGEGERLFPAQGILSTLK